mmetsp:Transcript_23917/g.59598  ORF Transcript_23917/g.59598 Transcript_23917/m.59598 type:complete len:230 (-) Transcript_23917:218-907(-)
MHWPSRKQAAPEEAPATSPPGGTAFSAPPSSEESPAAASRFSAPPPAGLPPAVGSAPPTASSYDNMDFSKYASSVYESDGLNDDRLIEQERRRSNVSNQWITHPRARACMNSIQLGAKMGASVGGCFGLLTGVWVAVTQRNLLVIPVSVIGGSISFGFFLGCGMIIRCEEKPPGSCSGCISALALPPPPSALETMSPSGVRRQAWESITRQRIASQMATCATGAAAEVE